MPSTPHNYLISSLQSPKGVGTIIISTFRKVRFTKLGKDLNLDLSDDVTASLVSKPHIELKKLG